MPDYMLIVRSLYCLEVIRNMPAHKNPTLVHNFIESPDPDGGKSIRYACIHRKNYDLTNSNRALAHLKECPLYLRKQANSVEEPLERPLKRQMTLQLGLPSLSNAKKQKLDQAAALAVYMGARPFALFDECYMRQFIEMLSDSLYKPLHRRQIGGPLLDQTYERLERQIMDLLDKQTYL